jgi:hypothetical protein
VESKDLRPTSYHNVGTGLEESHLYHTGVHPGTKSI